jgi:TrkA-C domain
VSAIYFLIPTILTIVIALLIVRAGGIALRMTGMPLQIAKFQALSAFTGVGFTTHEAESAVNVPSRRSIITWLMILGYGGIATVITTATTSLAQSRGEDIPINVVILGVGILVIVLLAHRTTLMRRWEAFVEARLSRLALFERPGIEEMLELPDGYGLMRLPIGAGTAHDGKTLADVGLIERHAIVLGIERSGKWLSAPPPDTAIAANDALVVYGLLKDLKSSGAAGRSHPA